jgi:hypothetical protein
MESCAMIAPPRFAESLLAWTLASCDRDAIVGDLSEEFNTFVIPQHGVTMARWWYRWQVARSLVPLFFRSWERASIARASVAVLGAGALAAIPATLLILLRTFVLRQVPLKTTAEMSTTFGVMLGAVVVVAGCAALVWAVRALRSGPA